MNLDEVKEGLAEGLSFKNVDNEGYGDYVRSRHDGHTFEHTYNGRGFGGVADLDISIMTPARWSVGGWEPWDV